MIKASIGQRRWYFIKSTFTIKMLLLFIVFLVLGVTILGLVLYVFSSSELDTRLFEAHSRIMNSWEILLPTIILTTISVFILVFLITLYMVIFLSHKIAGPLYKFEIIADEIGNGNFNVNVKLRKKDELTPLLTAFENMRDNLHGKIMDFKRNFKKTKNTEEKLKNAIETSTFSETEKNKLSTTVGELITEYEENLNAFTLKEIAPEKSSGPYYCPVHKWIGKCPEFPEGKDSESIQQ